MPPVLQSYRTLQRPSINLKLDNRSHFVMPLPMLFRTENVKFELTGRSRYKHHVSFCFVAHVRRLLRATPPRPPLRPRWPLSSPLCEKPRPLPLLSAELPTGISFSGIKKKKGKNQIKRSFSTFEPRQKSPESVSPTGEPLLACNAVLYILLQLTSL